MLPIEENYFDDIEIDGEDNVIVIDELNNYRRNLPSDVTKISTSSEPINKFSSAYKVTINLLDSGKAIKYRNVFPSKEEANIYEKKVSALITRASDSRNSSR